MNIAPPQSLSPLHLIAGWLGAFTWQVKHHNQHRGTVGWLCNLSGYLLVAQHCLTNSQGHTSYSVALLLSNVVGCAYMYLHVVGLPAADTRKAGKPVPARKSTLPIRPSGGAAAQPSVPGPVRMRLSSVLEGHLSPPGPCP